MAEKLFTLGKIVAVVSFISVVYFLASAGTNLTLYLTITAISILGMGIGGVLVRISDRNINAKSKEN
ncbi:MAG: hypothetical protein OK457_03965 [Thaumarchaeota archaeon]|nr:hypothetical protein [Nitrososphaerota archaeon]